MTPPLTAQQRLLLSDADAHLEWRRALPGTTRLSTGPDRIILGDSTGALALATLQAIRSAEPRGNTPPTPPRVFVWNRSYAASRVVRAMVLRECGAEAQAHVVFGGLRQDGAPEDHIPSLQELCTSHRFAGGAAIGMMPKSHAALADLALGTAALGVPLLLAAHTKHHNVAFNETLSTVYRQVRGLRGKGKHRSVLATQPRVALPAALPREGALGVIAVGGVFGGANIDRGGRLLAEESRRWLLSGATVLDLGCGNGTVSALLLADDETRAMIHTLIATDDDRDAVRSAEATLSRWVGDRGAPSIHITWDDAASRVPDGSVDLVALNPPFHDGTRVDYALVTPLLDAARRVLRTGGRLMLVHNSHARYRSVMEQRFSRVEQVARDRTFTVLTGVNT